MCRNKLLLVFQSMLLFLGSAPVVAVGFGLPGTNLWVNLKEIPYGPQLGGQRFAFLLDKAGMRRLSLPSFSAIFKEPELLFDTHVPQWAREKKPVLSTIPKNSSSYIHHYGGYAFAAVLVGAGMYGSYRLYKNLKTNKKGAL